MSLAVVLARGLSGLESPLAEVALSTLTRQFGSSIAVVEYYGSGRLRRLPVGPCFTATHVARITFTSASKNLMAAYKT